ncbi:hypothetical protein AVEN_99912-1 [Araneus ventricosus]|uniref:Uncharacterized protein n=1 Tax=Araneus ventricosus TaxID=182803 RepID=A0A4Y2J505_ARAVE|nr:hypothetical protein AVEN_99912-1 [Araneus ventricosus]
MCRLKSYNVGGGVAYTCSLMYPHRKKFNRARSGKRGQPEGQIARWIQRLQEYDFEIQHLKGTSQGNVDALSRRPFKESIKHCANAEKKFGMEKDISKKRNSADRPSWNEIAPEFPATKRYWALCDSLHLKDGVLYRRWDSDDGSSYRW